MSGVEPVELNVFVARLRWLSRHAAGAPASDGAHFVDCARLVLADAQVDEAAGRRVEHSRGVRPPADQRTVDADRTGDSAVRCDVSESTGRRLLQVSDRLVPPADEGSVRSDRTRPVRARRDIRVRARWHSCGSPGIAAPALDLAVGAARTGVVVHTGDRDEAAAVGRVELAVVVVAPAHDAAVVAKRTGVALGRSNVAKRVGGVPRRNRPRAPALQCPCRPDPAREVPTGGDGCERSRCGCRLARFVVAPARQRAIGMNSATVARTCFRQRDGG